MDRSMTQSRFVPPLRGGMNPGRTAGVTTPGSFANAPDVGGPLMFSSPDAPGMPAPSEKTAWDFLPAGWSVERVGGAGRGAKEAHGLEPAGFETGETRVVEFETARGERMRVTYPKGFAPITQLESARLGIVTREMKRVAEREPHFEELFPGKGAEAVRDEIAAGRLVIPCASGVRAGRRAMRTWARAP